MEWYEIPVVTLCACAIEALGRDDFDVYEKNVIYAEMMPRMFRFTVKVCTLF